ncbi:unnamed protein product, partial [Mesorhabditis spiculigera]
MCQVVSERQKLMADQIKIRRRQRKDTLLSLTRESITATISALSQMPNSNVNNLQAALLCGVRSSEGFRNSGHLIRILDLYAPTLTSGSRSTDVDFELQLADPPAPSNSIIDVCSV